MKHGDLTKDIIGGAMTVLNELKPGLGEKLYENALIIELAERGHTSEQQKAHWRNRSLGGGVPR
jgi:GxxExxY protein